MLRIEQGVIVKKADEVNVYDFSSDAQCKAAPYGIYDHQSRHALVKVGQNAVTSEFAVASIRDWWKQWGAVHYPKARHLLIEADAGGCNGHRPRLWKWESQKLADNIGLPITVRHYPSEASKWNLLNTVFLVKLVATEPVILCVP